MFDWLFDYSQISLKKNVLLTWSFLYISVTIHSQTQQLFFLLDDCTYEIKKVNRHAFFKVIDGIFRTSGGGGETVHFQKFLKLVPFAC